MDKQRLDTVQVLVTTMNAKTSDFNILTRMNIHGSCLVSNQSDGYYISENIDSTSSQIILTNPHTGISQGRNNLINNALSDICVLSDDDMKFLGKYEETVLNVFNKYKDYDVIIFNLVNGYKESMTNTDTIINFLNYKKYGAARFAFRRESVINKSIFFNNLFGASRYGSGEDTLFLRDCLRNGLKIIAVTESVAMLESNRESTWFDGYNEKYYFDKGALYYALNKYTFLINALQFSLRQSKYSKGEISSTKSFKLMMLGARDYKNINKGKGGER